MTDTDSIIFALREGDFWHAAAALAGATESRIAEIARDLSVRLDDMRERLDLLADLCDLPPAPAGMDAAARLRAMEAMGLLSAYLALETSQAQWRELTPTIAALAGGRALFRVREVSVKVLARIAGSAFRESRSFWQESLASPDPALAATTIRALAVSGAPPLAVLELFDFVVDDPRRAVRESLALASLPALGRRDARAVYVRLRRWSAAGGEIARWNVAHALGTTLGGMYIGEALEILMVLAADERPMVWRAAASALVQIAQRNPRLVLPEIARWRDDPKRFRCANLALETLARR
jgi:hypothetical protein